MLTISRENARSALDCGGKAAALKSKRKVRRLTDTALHGAFGTTIFMAARNLALRRRVSPAYHATNSLRLQFQFRNIP